LYKKLDRQWAAQNGANRILAPPLPSQSKQQRKIIKPAVAVAPPPPAVAAVPVLAKVRVYMLLCSCLLFSWVRFGGNLTFLLVLLLLAFA
jgi:hypothetical protein